ADENAFVAEEFKGLVGGDVTHSRQSERRPIVIEPGRWFWRVALLGDVQTSHARSRPRQTGLVWGSSVVIANDVWRYQSVAYLFGCILQFVQGSHAVRDESLRAHSAFGQKALLLRLIFERRRQDHASVALDGPRELRDALGGRFEIKNDIEHNDARACLG